MDNKKIQPKGKYLSLTIVSHPWLNANARGEGSGGNLSTLQRISIGQVSHTLLTGYSLRYAIRLAMEANGATMWRKVATTDSASGYGFTDAQGQPHAAMEEAPPNQWDFDDTALFGYMIAAKGSDDCAGAATSPVNVANALSTSPYDGDTTFALGVKAKDGSLAPFNFQRHFSRYVLSIRIKYDELVERRPEALRQLLKALRGLQVGGSQASNYSTLTPELIAFRTHEVPGQGGLYIGPPDTNEWAPDQELTAAPLERRIKALGLSNAEVALTKDQSFDEILGKVFQAVGL
jgi:CRISPR-associated autoregulator DevR family